MWNMFKINNFFSAASRCISVPLERYGRPKNSWKTFFPYIFHVYISRKTEWNIVYKYLKTKTFSRDTNILPQMPWTSNNFGNSATTIWGFWVTLNYPILNFKKTVCPKNIWMRHCFLLCSSIVTEWHVFPSVLIFLDYKY